MTKSVLAVAVLILLTGCQDQPPKPKIFTSIEQARETLQILDNIQINFCPRPIDYNIHLVDADREGAIKYLMKQGMSQQEAVSIGSPESEIMMNATEKLRNDPIKLSRLCSDFAKMDEVKHYLNKDRY